MSETSGKKKKKGAKARAAANNLAAAVSIHVTAKPDAPEFDAAFEAPEQPETPLQIALKQFDPDAKLDFGKKIRKAQETAELLQNQVEQARQTALQIAAFRSPDVPPEVVEAATVEADKWSGTLRTLSEAVRTEADKMSGSFVDKLPEAEKLRRERPTNNTIAAKLKAESDLRQRRIDLLKPAGDAADAIEAKRSAVKEAVDAVAEAKAGLTRIVGQAAERRAAEAQRQDELRRAKEGYASVAKSGRDKLAGGLLARAKAVKLPDNATITSLLDEADRLAGAQNWAGAQAKAQEASIEIRRLEREVRKTLGAQDAFEAQRKDSFAALNSLRVDLARLGIKLEGPLAPIAAEEKAADDHRKASRWQDGMAALDRLDAAVAAGEKLVPRFDHYVAGNPSRLLPATLAQVVALPALTTNEDVLKKLREIYEKQCDVARVNWVAQVFRGSRFIGSLDDHYSTYPDSIDVGVASVSVLKRQTGTICDDLFGAAAWHDRIHSTTVIGGIHYHKYWGELFSFNVRYGDPHHGLDVVDPEAFRRMEDNYDLMVQDMEDRVADACAKHGRVPNVNAGPAVT